MAEKKVISERLYSFSIHDFGGNLKDVIARLEYPCNDAFFNFSLEVRDVYDWDGDREEVVLFGDRLETDAEFNKRIESAKKTRETKKKNNEKNKIALEKEEKRLLENLIKKYGVPK